MLKPVVGDQTTLAGEGGFVVAFINWVCLHTKLKLEPAFKLAGTTVTVRFETEGIHGRPEIVHAKTFIPAPKPVIVVTGDKEFVMIPLPETKDHAPLPTVGVFAAVVILDEEGQTVWDGPAFDIVTSGFIVIVTFEEDGVQVLFVIVHAKILFPNPKPVTDEVLESEFVIAPDPETKLHEPTPITGVFAAIIAFGELMQRF